MYDHPPSYIVPYEDVDAGAKGLQLVRYRDKTVDSYIVEENTDIEQKLFIYFKDEKLYLTKHKFVPSTSVPDTFDETVETIEISSTNSKYTDFNGKKSEILLKENACSQKDANGNCQHGTISLNIVIKDSDQGRSSLLKTEPLSMESTFGFN